MEELHALSADINTLLAKIPDDIQSVEEFRAQSRNFVVGNSFDVFHGADTVTEKSVQDGELSRLHRLR